MQNIFILLATITIFVLGIIWNKKNPLNFFLKLFLVILGVMGIILCLQIQGLIIYIK